MDSVAGLFLSTNNADEEKVIRNQYYHIPHPTKEIIQPYGKGTHNTKEGIKYNTIQVGGYEDSSFPVICHKAILNKLTQSSGKQKEREKKKQ